MWDSTLPIRRLCEVLRRERRTFQPNGGEVYRLLGVRWYGEGCHIHDTSNGDTLQAPVLTRIHVGDVVYNKMWASRGSFGVVSPKEEGAVATSEYPVFCARNGLLTEYLRYVMQQPRFWGLAKAWSSGTTGRARLHPRDFLAMPVPVPSLQEQRVIARVLATLDDTIDGAEAYICQLRTTKHQVMRGLLALGHPDYRTKLVPLPEPWRIGRVAPDIERMPKRWQLVTLTDVARLESGHTPSRNHPEYWEGDIPWISLQDTEGLKQLVISETVETTGPLGIKNSSARLLPKDTVVFSRTATVGLCARMGREMATSQDFANWVCGPKLDPRYLVQVFRHMDREWKRLQAGSTHQTVYMPVFKKLKILLPPRKEQEAIADVGDAFDERILAEQRYLEQLRAAKRGLAQALLSGRIRVGGAGNVLQHHLDKPPVSEEVNHA